jgi:hypothetical protein
VIRNVEISTYRIDLARFYGMYDLAAAEELLRRLYYFVSLAICTDSFSFFSLFDIVSSYLSASCHALR